MAKAEADRNRLERECYAAGQAGQVEVGMDGALDRDGMTARTGSGAKCKGAIRSI